MIISKEKLNKLLEIFSTPKNISPYDNTIEKKEMQNAKSFINNYHMYGPPLKYSKSELTLKTINNYISNSHSNINQNKGTNLDNKNNIYKIELKKSIVNLRKGQKVYKNEQKLEGIKKNISKSTTNIFGYKNSIYNNIHCYFDNNNNVINSIYKNPNYSNNNYIFKTNIGKSSKLKEISPNPEDVIIKDLPKKYIQANKSMDNSNINQIPANHSTIHLNKENIFPS